MENIKDKMTYITFDEVYAMITNHRDDKISWDVTVEIAYVNKDNNMTGFSWTPYLYPIRASVSNNFKSKDHDQYQVASK